MTRLGRAVRSTETAVGALVIGYAAVEIVKTAIAAWRNRPR